MTANQFNLSTAPDNHLLKQLKYYEKNENIQIYVTVKTSASKPLGMAVNGSKWVQPEVPYGYKEF